MRLNQSIKGLLGKIGRFGTLIVLRIQRIQSIQTECAVGFWNTKGRANPVDAGRMEGTKDTKGWLAERDGSKRVNEKKPVKAGVNLRIEILFHA